MLQELLAKVAEARKHLDALLTKEERRRPQFWGSDPLEWSIEDPAREVAAHFEDPRSPRALLDLADFQAAINAVLEHMRSLETPQRLATQWLRGTSPAKRIGHFRRTEVEAEVLWIVRGLLAKLENLDTMRDFENFCFTCVKRELTKWSNRARVPVALPRSVARVSETVSFIRRGIR